MTTQGGVASRLATTGFAAMLIAGLASAPATAEMPEPENQFLSLGTSAVGGTWFPLGGAMASVVSNVYPQLNITAEVTGGTLDNLRLMGNEHLELALSTNEQAFLAVRGEEPFERPVTNFGGVLGGHGIYWQLYTLRNTGIETIEDLRGARVSLGAPGSIGNDIGQLVIEAHGLTMNEDWSPEYLGHGDGPGALRDGRVQAVLIISSFPTSAVIDITSTEGEDVVFINPDPDVLAELMADRPYWSEVPIPGGVYPGHPDDIPGSFGAFTILIAHEDLDDATVYAITKALLENPDRLQNAHALGAEWTTETATRGIDGVIPFHPGAEAYLREAGLL